MLVPEPTSLIGSTTLAAPSSGQPKNIRRLAVAGGETFPPLAAHSVFGLTSLLVVWNIPLKRILQNLAHFSDQGFIRDLAKDQPNGESALSAALV